MRFVLVSLAILGFVASGLALREHYRTDLSPCSINERWDCGIVNHSPFATLAGIPVAVIGMAGYVFLAALAMKRAYLLFLVAALAGLSFSLYLAHVERDILGVWCIYCVASLAVISLLTLLSIGTVVASRSRRVNAAN
jgi:vitamin-K-epoxide reductase (warfarin-sensitive)